MPNNLERPPLGNTVLEESELCRAMSKNHSGRSSGGSEMIGEDMKRWLKNIELEEKTEVNGKEGCAGIVGTLLAAGETDTTHLGHR